MAHTLGEKRMLEFLDMLRANPNYASGESLGRKIGVSRSAVWKYIRRLRRLGYKIESLQGKGYLLKETTDYPIPWELTRILETSFVGKTLIYKEKINSTQALALVLAENQDSHGTVVIAGQQSGGRGRLKRKWLSPPGGIWISVILKPNISTAASTVLPFVASVAVCDAIRDVAGLVATLKWPNDVMIKRKKVAGILLDLSAEANVVNYAVIGIGLNANIDSKKLRVERDGRPDITSLSDELCNNISRLHLTKILLEKLEYYFTLFEAKGTSSIIALWLQRTEMFGKKVSVFLEGKAISGMAKTLNDDGSLVLATATGDLNIVSGDVVIIH